MSDVPQTSARPLPNKMINGQMDSEMFHLTLALFNIWTSIQYQYLSEILNENLSFQM